jgi:Lrp/AsnC family transcriptional regulator, leucine-responsive regulatory protein
MTNEPRLDPVDERILAILQRDGRRTYAEIAALVGLTPPSAHDRVKKLEARGVIRGYEAQVDPSAAGYQVLAFVLVVQDQHAEWDAVSAHFRSIAEIVECHHIAGEEDFLLKVRARDTRDLERVLHAVVGGGHVGSVRTMVVLSSPFEGRTVPLSAGPVQGHGRAQNGRLRSGAGGDDGRDLPGLDQPGPAATDSWSAVDGPPIGDAGESPDQGTPATPDGPEPDPLAAYQDDRPARP